MRYASMVVATAIVLALTGCASKPGDEYWIRGLTLPRGSTIIHREERALTKDEETMFHDLAKQLGPGFSGPVDSVLAVGFNCPAGWDSVVTHIDGCLKRQGYTEKGMNPGLQRVASSDPRIAKALNSQHIYAKSGEKFLVLVQDTTGGTDVPAPPGVGAFSLSVFRYK